MTIEVLKQIDDDELELFSAFTDSVPGMTPFFHSSLVPLADTSSYAQIHLFRNPESNAIQIAKVRNNGTSAKILEFGQVKEQTVLTDLFECHHGGGTYRYLTFTNSQNIPLCAMVSFYKDENGGCGSITLQGTSKSSYMKVETRTTLNFKFTTIQDEPETYFKVELTGDFINESKGKFCNA